MPTHQGRGATAAEASQARGRAFEAFTALHVFDLVLDELNLEHVAQLMMCCRSLRERGRGKGLGGGSEGTLDDESLQSLRLLRKSHTAIFAINVWRRVLQFSYLQAV